jgi:hypothetical protein
VRVGWTALWFAAGAGAEVLNTITRKWTVERLQGFSTLGWLLVGIAFRLAFTAVVLMLAFRHDPAYGASALGGYLICRWVMIWWINRPLSEMKDTIEHRS